jgi:polysaccharide biosynthesis protein PslH
LNSSKTSRKKLVIITSRFPFPLEKGDKLRAFHQIKDLSKVFNIVLIATTDVKVSQSQLEQIKPFVSTIHLFHLNKISIVLNLFFKLFSKKPFQTGYFYSSKINYKIKQILKEEKPNHILCQLIRVSEYVKNYHDCPKTLDFMDALSKGIERRISKTSLLFKWLFRMEAKRLTLYERQVFDYFENHIIISNQDKQLILHPDHKQIKIIPNGVDQNFLSPLKIEKEAELVFVGNMSYAPNVDAIHYIHKHLLSRLPKSFRLLVSGANPHPSILKLAQENTQIHVTGWLEDIREGYCKGKVFLAPMMIGTGMQNKLIEAMALGIPCITTTLANNAIGGIHGESIMEANSPEEFVQHINELLENKILYKSIAENGQTLVREKYNWTTINQELIQLIQNS